MMVGFVIFVIAVLGATRAQFRPNLMNGAWGNNGLAGLANVNNRRLWGANTPGTVMGNQQNTQYITCIGKNTAGDQMRVTIQNGQTQQNFFNPFMRPTQSQIIKMEARIMISPSSQTSGQFQIVITENSRVEDGCLGRYLGRIIDNRPWWITTANQETGIIGRPFSLSPGHVASTSEIIEGFNSIFDANGRGIALCPSSSIRNGRCVDDPGAMIPMCCKAGLDRIPATTPIPQTQFGQQGNFNNVNTMGTMMPNTGTRLPTNNAGLTGQTGNGDLSNLFGRR